MAQRLGLHPRTVRVHVGGVLRTRDSLSPPRAGSRHRTRTPMRLLRRFVRFWYDFIVGDDWRLAIGVVLTAVVVSVGTHLGTNVWWLAPLAIGAALGSSVHVAFRRAHRP